MMSRNFGVQMAKLFAKEEASGAIASKAAQSGQCFRRFFISCILTTKVSHAHSSVRRLFCDGDVIRGRGVNNAIARYIKKS